MIARRYAGLLLLCLLPGAGCAQSEFVEVTGDVTWKGEPIDNGEIILFPVDTHIAPTAGKINDGQFTVLSKPGKMRVKIQAVRWTGKKDPVEGFEITELYIPAKYNDKTELEADVTAEGDNHFEFALTE